MPRYMLLLKADDDTEAGVLPTKEVAEGMGNLIGEMIAAGIFLGGEGLKPSSQGRRVVIDEGKVASVIDGPFAETKELVAGYVIIDVPNMDEVMKWTEKFAAVVGSGSSEIRPLYETSDFPDEIMSPEAKAEEDAWRQESQRRAVQA